MNETTRLQFFSGQGPANEAGHHGYDGSMTVANFKERDLPRHALAMDCIYGPVVVMATMPGGYFRAYSFDHQHVD